MKIRRHPNVVLLCTAQALKGLSLSFIAEIPKLYMKKENFIRKQKQKRQENTNKVIQ
jgi:hypothetical protein